MGLSISYMKQIELLKKNDFINMYKSQFFRDAFSKWKVKDLRDHFKLTHKIDGKLIDGRGKCYKCLTTLQPDYTQFKNYCIDCS